MKQFFKFQKWWYLKTAEFTNILLWLLIPYLIAAAYFSGISTALCMIGVIIFFLVPIQYNSWKDFRREQEFEEWQLVQILKGTK